MSNDDRDAAVHDRSKEPASAPLSTQVGEAIGAAADAISRTRGGVRVALSTRIGRLSFGLSSLGYLLLYLWIVQDLGPGRGSVAIVTVPDLSRALVSTGPFSYDAIAIIAAGPVTYLFSPLNLMLGSMLAGLVGLNLALTVVVWRQPAACGIDASAGTGLLAGLPALLSGTACCGPLVLVVVGIQASGLVLTVFDFLVPAAVVLLLGGVLLVGRRVDRSNSDQ